MSIGSRMVIECDGECELTLGLFFLEKDAIEYAKYGDHDWTAVDEEWLFGTHTLTYCPAHAPAFDPGLLGEYSSGLIELLRSGE